MVEGSIVYVRDSEGLQVLADPQVVTRECRLRFTEREAAFVGSEVTGIALTRAYSCDIVADCITAVDNILLVFTVNQD